jgi:hypothetical protein
LKNHLVALVRQPQSLNNFYQRLERAFEHLARHERLNYPPKQAAAIFWSGAIGAALKIAAAQRHMTTFAPGADETMRVILLNAIIKSAPVRKRAPRARLRLPSRTSVVSARGKSPARRKS